MKTHVIVPILCLLAGGLARAGAAPLERFATEETVVVEKKVTAAPKLDPNARYVRLRLGEIKPLLESKGGLFSAPKEAFYLPPEATGIVQLIVEKKGFTVSYFLKALRRGRTSGGVVERSWLDKAGFKPKTVADEGRVQQALRTSPWYITVE